MILVTLASCNRSPVYQHEYHLEIEHGWAYEQLLEFNFEIQDTARRYDLFLDLEHSPDFSTENLYVRLHTIYPENDTIVSPLSLELANQAGQWFGNCNKSYCNLSIPLQENIFFDKVGEYGLVVEQYMRESPVMGVNAVGIRLYASSDD